MPFLGDVSTAALCGALDRLQGWTARDVEAVAELRVRNCGKTLITAPDNPVSYLWWLLKDADPQRPPVQLAQQAAAQNRAMTLARSESLRAEFDRRAADAVPAARAAGAQQARVVAVVARGRSAATRRPEPPAPVVLVDEHHAPPNGHEEHVCTGGCGSYGTHVQPHTSAITGRTFAYCPTCWDAVRHVF